MSILPNAHRPVIEGGQFTTVNHGDAHIYVADPKASSNRDLDRLLENVATGAFHDAAERGDPPKCHPQTRIAILTEIKKWVQDPEVRKEFILWLYGPAGAGKSAIAQTIAEILAKEGILVASFFFSRTGIGRNDTSRFIASIAYQLALAIPETRTYIAVAVEQDPLVFSRTLLAQMQVLIIQPLNAAATPANTAQPRLVIIDGLDEASVETTQQELLKALTSSVQQLHVPLIFLVASRPEYCIRQAFNREPLQSLMHGLALDEEYKADDDIRTFIFAKFDKIKVSHPSGNILPVHWPSEEDVNYLVSKASGQFIYASTVMKYISSPRDHPKKQLQIILGLSDPGKDTPFAQLDALYHHILSSVKDISRVLEILSLVLLQTGYREYLTVEFIETLLGYDSGDVAVALTDMHALVYVPPSDMRNDDNRLRMYHASLHDFLFDKSRSERYFLDARVQHANLARHLLRYITTVPKQDYMHSLLQAIWNGFLDHYLEVSHMADLVADLKNLSLVTLLSNISLEVFYGVQWDSFFIRLRSECSNTNTGLYQRLINEFDSWICTRYERYPEFIHTIISAVYATPDGSGNNIADIFDILAHSLPRSEAIFFEILDRELFQFQNRRMTKAYYHRRTTLQIFFTDPYRAGIHFADGVKCGKLAEEIVKVLCRRPEALAVMGDKYPDRDTPDSELFWKLNSRSNGKLTFFPEILNAAPDDPKRAQLLWELAVQYKNNDSITKGRKVMADACLAYVKRCGIYIPEHEHGADCSICANYKPVFPISSLEAEIENTENKISTSNELDTSQSGHLLESLQYTRLESPPLTQLNSSAAPRSASLLCSPEERCSTTATHNRPTKSLSSTVRHFSNPPFTSVLSPLPTRSTRTRTRTRPSSAALPTSHYPKSSGLLSATSRTQTRNPTSSSRPSHLSPDSPSTSGVAQSSTSSLPQRKAKSSSRNAAASAEVLARQSSKKNASKKPVWK